MTGQSDYSEYRDWTFLPRGTEVIGWADLTRAGFLAAILAEPGDSLPKLVFADFLDEGGEGSLAFAYRWCAARGKMPWHTSHRSIPVGERWSWVFPIPTVADHHAMEFLPRSLARGPMQQGRHDHTRHATYAEAMEALAGGLQSLRDILECGE